MHQSTTPIDFRANTQAVQPQIPASVQRATRRLLGTRASVVGVLGDERWQQLRQAGHDLRLHTVSHLDHYLTLLEKRVTEAGGHVHWARDGEEANRIVLEIARSHGVRRAVKVKSMATEEIGLNHALIAAGIQTLETDLGEYIVQLAGVAPSHIIAPAVHLTKEDIADLFREKLGVDAPAEPVQLAAIARARLREAFLTADMGISGANFMVAETGTLVIVSNEGNGRMCTTLPPLHVAVVGIDKVVPDLESLDVLLKLLPRSGTGQKMTCYTSFITGPSRNPRRRRAARASPGAAGQRPYARAQRSAGPGVAALHPLRRLSERLPGLQPCGRARLWQHLFGPHRLDPCPSAAGCQGRWRSAVRVLAMRRMRGILPRQNTHPGDLDPSAPARGRG